MKLAIQTLIFGTRASFCYFMSLITACSVCDGREGSHTQRGSTLFWDKGGLHITRREQVSTKCTFCFYLLLLLLLYISHPIYFIFSYLAVDHRKMASSEKIRKVETNAENPNTDFGRGHIVWANFGKDAWWPGMVVEGKDVGQTETKPDGVWIFWFGDNNFSQIVRKRNLLDFKDNFESKTKRFASKKMQPNFEKNIRCALGEMISRDNLTIGMDALQWAKNGFTVPSESTKEVLGKVKSITERTQKILADIRTRNTSKGTRKSNLSTKSENDDEVKNDASKKESALEKVRNGILDIKAICVACDLLEAKVEIQHPIMEGGLCLKCKNHLMETFYSIGDDGLYTNCMLCSLEGHLVICDDKDCTRSFCTECIDMLVSPDAVQKVKNSDPWYCYVCKPFNKDEFGLVKIKQEWRKNMENLFSPSESPSEKEYRYSENEERSPENENSPKQKKSKSELTVLSVFDGIGTGRVVLDELNIKIKKYYAYEIDEDAITVSKMKLPKKIDYLGDVKDFKDSVIQEIGPIDLLIGGSPCNDLSRANPIRKGLYDSNGTGPLFFYFYKILRAIQCENQKTGRKLYWLFENVASMPTAFKDDIGNFFECDPVLIDARHFSPMNRARLFWGNVPSLYVPIPMHIIEKEHVLQSALIKNLNRTATVKKLRTVTTKSNSLKQGKEGNFPVKMNGKEDTIWTTELERVFGFEDHYTDTGNLKHSRRRELLGRCWSVPVVKYLLQPLKTMYKLDT